MNVSTPALFLASLLLLGLTGDSSPAALGAPSPPRTPAPLHHGGAPSYAGDDTAPALSESAVAVLTLSS